MDKPARTHAIEKLLNETRRISPRRWFLMAVVALAAGIYLFTLKHEGEQVRTTTAQERATLDAEISERLPKLLGGASKNTEQLALVARVAAAITTHSDASKAPTPLTFHLMAEPNSINIYGLADGNIYVTTALLNRMQTEGQLAAALAHAAAHALVKDHMTVVAAASTIRPIWQHTAQQERAADMLTVTLMSQAGYDPNAFASMLGVLAKAYTAKAEVTFFTTHPNTADRLDGVTAAITALYPQGVPAVLSK